MKDLLTLELSINELNSILSALGKRPYEEIFQLVNKIQEQAQKQMHEQSDELEAKLEKSK